MAKPYNSRLLTIKIKKFTIWYRFSGNHFVGSEQSDCRMIRSRSEQGHRPVMVPPGRPFWLPASNYYALTTSVVAAFFFLVWGILHDGGDEMPWITAGVGASIILFMAVVTREVFLRRARRRYMLSERNYNQQMREVYARMPHERESQKLTIEQNSAILKEIARKSSAAKTLGKFSAVHREVFELCGEYLERNERELRMIGPGSPRLKPLRSSRRDVREFHRYHMLQWAGIEAREMTHEAQTRVSVADKVEAAQSAINIVESALEHYPSERTLIESRELLADLLTSIKVAHWVEKAELAEYRGDFKGARSLYRDALFYLGRDNTGSDQRGIAAAKISSEIERLSQMDHSE